SVDPREADDNAGLVGAVLIVDPAFLADLLAAAALLPEVDAADRVMTPPERAMVIVVRRRRMPHPRQRPPGRTEHRKEERPRIARAEVPAQLLLAIDLERHLVVCLRNDLHAGELVAHGGKSRVMSNE